MTKSSLICWVLFLTLVSGCASAPRERIAITPGREASLQEPSILADAIDRKIARLETLLKEKRIRLEDEPLAVIIINAYQSAKSCLDAGLPTACEGANHDLLQGLSLIDERYFKLSGSEMKPPNLQAGDNKEKEAIFSAYAKGDFQGVIQQCADLMKRSGPDGLSYELQTVLALSLGAENRYGEAIQVGERALAGRFGLPESNELRLKLAEWQLALGHKSETSALLKSIDQSVEAISLKSKEVETRMSALKNLPALPPETPGHVQGSGALTGSDVLEAVKELVKGGRFEEARSMLQENRESIQNGSQPDAYEHALEGLEKAEEQYLREQIGVISSKEQTIASARKLVDAQEYEEAIATIDSLGVEESVNGPARALLDEAVSGIVNRERNRAAKAFYLAKQTDDPLKKEAFLQSSRDILKQLIDKYPSSNLINKIKSNLNTVEAEIAKVGSNH